MGIEGGETVSMLAYADALFGVQPEMVPSLSLSYSPFFESAVLSVIESVLRSPDFSLKSFQRSQDWDHRSKDLTLMPKRQVN